jgi:hypothetical protein
LFAVPEVEHSCNTGGMCTKCVWIVCRISAISEDEVSKQIIDEVWVLMFARLDDTIDKVDSTMDVAGTKFTVTFKLLYRIE